MGRRGSWIVAWIAGLELVSTPSIGQAGDMPTCNTSSALAYPTALAGTTHAIEDEDGDGLLDQAELELAACVVPKYHFDGDEPSLRGGQPGEPLEPIVLFAAYPDGVSNDSGRLRIRVVFAELYAKDGGFIFCNFPEVNGCNAHRGDAQIREVVLEATSLTSARIIDAAGCESFDTTHVNLYASWGKHHAYCQPYVCDDPHHLDACDCGHPSCGLGHWDRADGRGPTRVPTVARQQNAGQLEVFDYAASPRHGRTPRGFINSLTNVGFPGEYVYDPCRGANCDPIARLWRSFLDGKAWFERPIMSVYRAVVRFVKTPPIHLRALRNLCSFGLMAPQKARDTDGDGIIDDCDPCPGGSCACFVDGREALLPLGFGSPADPSDESDALPPDGPPSLALLTPERPVSHAAAMR
jgi:hypothetical protein